VKGADFNHTSQEVEIIVVIGVRTIRIIADWRLGGLGEIRALPGMARLREVPALQPANVPLRSLPRPDPHADCLGRSRSHGPTAGRPRHPVRADRGACRGRFLIAARRARASRPASAGRGLAIACMMLTVRKVHLFGAESAVGNAEELARKECGPAVWRSNKRRPGNEWLADP
jgi:hypothetical protein